MNYWLMKSEPDSFSIDDLKRVKKTMWDGVRNYQVRNMMRNQMKKRDRALFYHSSNGGETGVVGEMEIVKEAYPDTTQFDSKSEHFDPKSKSDEPTWLCVDVKFVQKFKTPVYLKELKLDPAFTGMIVTQKGSRLSVSPINQKHYTRILKMGSS